MSFAPRPLPWQGGSTPTVNVYQCGIAACALWLFVMTLSISFKRVSTNLLALKLGGGGCLDKCDIRPHMSLPAPFLPPGER